MVDQINELKRRSGIIEKKFDVIMEDGTSFSTKAAGLVKYLDMWVNETKNIQNSEIQDVRNTLIGVQRKLAKYGLR